MTQLSTFTVPNVTELPPNQPEVWEYPPEVIVVATVVVSVVVGVALLLNTVLVMTIQFSPSLKTPPNSHLLNICMNNLLLAVHMLLALPALYLNGVDVPRKGSEVLSGLQLFLMMHCLLQYWGAFTSIGYYRFKTIHHPSLSIRYRKLLVSRSITTTWVISLLLAMTFSLTSSRSSSYLPLTLDPFRRNYFAFAHEDDTGEDNADDGLEEDSEQVVVMSLVLAVLLLGLGIILTSYYSICRTLNLTGRAGKCRVSPWPRHSSSLPPPLTDPAQGCDNTDLGMAACGRAYRPEPVGQPFCVSGPQGIQETTWIVHYQKCDHNLLFEDLLSLEKPRHLNNQSPNSAAERRCMYATKRPLAATLSTGSTTSQKTTGGKYADFTDISIGGDIIRMQKLQCRSALRKQSVRRERGSLSSASKNSLVMLVAYLLCSLPLIVCQVPGTLSHIAPENRVVALLICRLLFFLNAPVYPLWYLLFSLRVKKCLARMCETLLVRFQYRT